MLFDVDKELDGGAGFRRLLAAGRCGGCLLAQGDMPAAFGGFWVPCMPSACLANMHSLDASDMEAIWECVSVVSMCETSSDGRESAHVMFVCHVRVAGHVGSAPIGVDQELVFAGHL